MAAGACGEGNGMHNGPTAQLASGLGGVAAPNWQAAGASAATCRGLQYQLAAPSQPRHNHCAGTLYVVGSLMAWRCLHPRQWHGMAWHGMTWALLKENMASKQRAREITSSATPWRPPATHTAAPVHVKVTRETCKGLLPDAENSWIWEQGWAGSYASRQLCGMNEVGASG